MTTPTDIVANTECSEQCAGMCMRSYEDGDPPAFWCYAHRGAICTPECPCGGICSHESDCDGREHGVVPFATLLAAAADADKCDAEVREAASEILMARAREAKDFDLHFASRFAQIERDIQAAKVRVRDAFAERATSLAEEAARLKVKPPKLTKQLKKRLADETSAEEFPHSIAMFLSSQRACEKTAKRLAAECESSRPLRFESLDEPFFALMDQLRNLNDDPDEPPETPATRVYKSYCRKRDADRRDRP